MHIQLIERNVDIGRVQAVLNQAKRVSGALRLILGRAEKADLVNHGRRREFLRPFVNASFDPVQPVNLLTYLLKQGVNLCGVFRVGKRQVDIHLRGFGHFGNLGNISVAHGGDGLVLNIAYRCGSDGKRDDHALDIPIFHNIAHGKETIAYDMDAHNDILESVLQRKTDDGA